MRKLLIKILLVVFCVVFVPVFAIVTFSWYSDYRETRNNFTVAQVCQIKQDMDINDALKIMGNPAPYQVYNFSNVFSNQYRNVSKGYFVEIIYDPDTDKIEDIFWGRGRLKTLAQSGVCANF